MAYRAHFQERFSGVAVQVGSVTRVEDNTSSEMLQEFDINFTVDAVRRSNARMVQVKGLAVVHLRPAARVGTIAKGFVTLSWQTGLGSNPLKQSVNPKLAMHRSNSVPNMLDRS
eukprot:TRINITY_DN7283_c0_g1_i2.p2 TRINITY_DN7283_c0_g1~~TRINITY_DN7283_c0_g1_i2.p2  ORF type:complete len:114 (-),score=23.07 TRINITY_DN7283_c0_g1_i2:226-567(-)